MRSTTLRWILLSCSIIISLILLAQLYWLKRLYTLEEQHFNTNVVKSIRGLYNDLKINTDAPKQVSQIVELIDVNTYLVKIDSIPPKDSLLNFLSNEFEDFDVWTDCNVSVYNSNKEQFLYQYYLPTAGSRYSLSSNVVSPVLKKNYNYLLLNFPFRSKYIIHEMLFWIITGVVLLLVLIGLSIGLLYLYRQKFLNELQKDFVNNFTHEFKTPLAVMKIASDVILQPGIIKNPERFAKYGNVIKEQTEHLQIQVERLLKTTASENSKLTIHKEACELNLLVKNILEQIDPFIKSQQAIVDFVPDENEPVIFADKVHLQLVVINLVENAIKYKNGTPHVIIELHDTDNGMYAICVKDNGIGIEQKNFKYLFKKFYRVPTGNVHEVHGFGLGLNFVKKIVDAHNGKIIINSVLGIGTELKILLPKK
jgi:two-component system, OmpR family, phosphate regulon sensor histidine kinase PhoR